MADDEKLIASALQTVLKSAKIPAELYEKKQYELRVDDSDVVKINMTLKRGLVLDIEEDSHFRNFLNNCDIVLTVNDKIAAKPDFKLQDLFKERGAKVFTFTYIRMKCATEDKPPIEDSERRDGYQYLVFALFHFQRVPVGLTIQTFQGSKVMVMDVAPKSIGSLCFLPGDIIMLVNSTRIGSDAARTLDTIATEIEQKGFARVTVERPVSEVAKAIAVFSIQKSENRDLPVPTDCAAYVKEALKALKTPEPKSIMKSSSSTPDGPRVGFHERIHAESVIPSDIADELLVKTPSRVPAVTAALAAAQPLPLAPPQPPSQPAAAASAESTDREAKEKESLVGPVGQMTKPPSEQSPPPPVAATPPPAPAAGAPRRAPTGRAVGTGGSNKRDAEDKSKQSKGRKKASAEQVLRSKKAGGSTPANKKSSNTKTKKGKKKEAHGSTGGDTEGTALS